MYHAGVKDPIFFRLGTCGGIGIEGGNLVVSESAVDGMLNPYLELVSGKLGTTYPYLELVSGKLGTTYSYLELLSGLACAGQAAAAPCAAGQGARC
ncbi:hypothetical protein HAZT_HAZT012145 [Hyalella azteca]|uniref:Uncharacterized protein n=1 Tax=Hyalella azteca TaxID=294128 RepID=A0A6A0H3N3_HYAAZ|nr:hypothetical protein HAZT_HAZT012145 [Hyalella azteca]